MNFRKRKSYVSIKLQFWLSHFYNNTILPWLNAYFVPGTVLYYLIFKYNLINSFLNGIYPMRWVLLVPVIDKNTNT